MKSWSEPGEREKKTQLWVISSSSNLRRRVFSFSLSSISIFLHQMGNIFAINNSFSQSHQSNNLISSYYARVTVARGSFSSFITALDRAISLRSGTDLIIDYSFCFAFAFCFSVVYGDYSSSGRSLQFLEDYINKEVLPAFGDVECASAVTGLQTLLYKWVFIVQSQIINSK